MYFYWFSFLAFFQAQWFYLCLVSETALCDCGGWLVL